MDTKEIKELLEFKNKYGNNQEDGILDNLIQSVILAAVFGAFVMLIWNALMPDLFSFPKVDYLQSVGIIILARLIFGGLTLSPGNKNKSRKRSLRNLSKLDDISDWKHYDKFWEEEGKKHFDDYKSKKTEDSK